MRAIIKRIVFALAILIGACNAVAAPYAIVPVTGIGDHAFGRDGVLYVAAGSTIVRYDVANKQFLPAFNIGGSLIGIDVSPDGQTLAVADSSTDGNTNRIHLVDAQTGVDSIISFPLSFYETGTYMVAWGSDSKILISSKFNGSGSVPLRRYDPAHGTTQEIGSIQQDSMLTPSADRSTIGIAEGNDSAGPVSAYSITSGGVVATTSVGSATDNVAVDPSGTQFAVPTSMGVFVLDRADPTFQVRTMLAAYPVVLSAAYSPISPHLFTTEYSFSGESSGVKVYDTRTFADAQIVDPFSFDEFPKPRIKVSPDGHWLAISALSTIRIYDISSIINPPPLRFSLSSPAQVGLGIENHLVVTALDAGNNIAVGYTGAVHFTSSDTAAVLPADASLSNGVGTFAFRLNTAGTQTITATDTVAPSATGTSLPITAVAGSTITSLSGDLGPGAFAHSMTWIAFVTGNFGLPTGSVSFKNDGAILCRMAPLILANGQMKATCSSSSLTSGTHVISVEYSGDGVYPGTIGPLTYQTIASAPACTVNGKSSQTLQAAVDTAMPGDIINVSGYCAENVVVRHEKARLTIDGGNAAVLVAASPTVAALTLRGKGILVQNLVISGGAQGIEVQRGSTASLNHDVIEQSQGDGVRVHEIAFATLTNSTIRNNAGHGVAIAQGGAANIGFNFADDSVASPNVIQNNGERGISVSERSTAWIVGNTLLNNGDDGIAVLRDSHATLAGNAINGNGINYTAGSNCCNGVSVADKGSVYFGGDASLAAFFRATSTTTSPNLHFGLNCANGGVVSGFMDNSLPLAGAVGEYGGGTANGLAGSCNNALLPH